MYIIQMQLAPDEIMIMVASQTKKVSIVDCRKKQVRFNVHSETKRFIYT